MNRRASSDIEQKIIDLYPTNWKPSAEASQEDPKAGEGLCRILNLRANCKIERTA